MKSLLNWLCKSAKTHGESMYAVVGQSAESETISPFVAGIVANIQAKKGDWSFDAAPRWSPLALSYQYSFRHVTGITFVYMLQKFGGIVVLKVEPEFAVNAAEQIALMNAIYQCLVKPQIDSEEALKAAVLETKLEYAKRYFIT